MTDKLLQNYPKQVTLGLAGAQVILRPLEPTDEYQLLQFFNRIPAEDRYYLKEDVSSSSVIAKWARNIDYDQVLPLIALVDSEIVADATLHRNQAGAHRHMGEIRIVVEPSHRNQGLGTVMLEELIYIAYDRGQDRIFMQLVEEREDNAIRVAEMMGFQRVATLPGFAKEITGEDRNLVILELTLEGRRLKF